MEGERVIFGASVERKQLLSRSGYYSTGKKVMVVLNREFESGRSGKKRKLTPDNDLLGELPNTTPQDFCVSR